MNLHLLRKLRALMAASAGLFCLSACSIPDSFGPRADTYNRQAHDVRTELLLLNIMRSSMGDPLEWSVVSQVTGTASLGGQISGSFPIVGHLAKGQLVYPIAPQVSGSAGPQFVVPILDTKEFQTGIATPLTPQIMRLLLDDGYPLEVVLPLVLSQIEYSRGNGPTFRIENGPLPVADPLSDRLKPVPRSVLGYAVFNAAIRDLVTHGLTIQVKPDAVGSILFRKDLGKPKDISDAEAGGFKITRYELGSDNPKDPNLNAADVAFIRSQKQTTYWRAVRSIPALPFCFDPMLFEEQKDLMNEFADPRYQYPSIIVKKEYDDDHRTVFLGNLDNPQDKVNGTIKITPQLECGYQGTKSGSNETLTFTPRSVEGIIRYLGDLARIELELGDQPNKEPKIALDAGNHEPLRPTLFRVVKGSISSPAISTTLDNGDVYSVAITRPETDYSSRVLALLGELVNLNNSAKDLPAPNVISIIAP